jgi:hypothetical protein
VKRYGALDLGFAGLYAWLGFRVVPSRSTTFTVALAILIALLVASGVGLLANARWGRVAGIVASAVLLGFAAAVILGLVASSAYLRGVYGPLGQGMAIVSLLIAALVVEAFALLPIFQLRFLLKRRVP